MEELQVENRIKEKKNSKLDIKKLFKLDDTQSFLWGFPRSTEKQKQTEIRDLKEVEKNRLNSEKNNS